MRKKHLAVLVAILVVLLGLVVLKEAGREAPRIEEVVQLARLVPQEVEPADVQRLRLYSGDRADEAVVLARRGDEWRVASQFDAPANEETVEEYVDSLVALQGEPRAGAESEPDLAEYNLTDDSAFHVEGYTDPEAEEPAFHLLVGESPGMQQTFVRAAGEQMVYVSDVNFRSEAGVWAEDGVPEANQWLDKQVLTLAKNSITRAELDYPDKRLVFVKAEEEAAADEAGDAGTEDRETQNGETETADAEGPVPVEDPLAEWSVAEGGPGNADLKPGGLDRIIGAFDTGLAATDIVDPAAPAEWGLETPGFTLTIAAEGRDEPVIIEGGRPDPAGDGYIRLADRPDVIYQVSKFAFERMWPRGADLFDLPAVTVDQAAINRITVEQPEGAFTLAKTGDEWTVAAPQAAFEPATNTIDTLVRAIPTLRAADYADSIAGTGLEPAERMARWETADAAEALPIGAESPVIDGRYAQFPGHALPYAISRTDVSRLLVDPADLYQRALFDFGRADVTAVRWQGADSEFALLQSDGGWTLALPGEEAPADPEAALDFAGTIAELQAADILFDTAALPAQPTASLEVDAAGTTYRIDLAPEADGERPAQMAGRGVFTLATADVAAIAGAPDTLRMPEPEAEAGADTGDDGEAVPIEAEPLPTPPVPQPATPETAGPPAETAEPAGQTPAPAADAPATAAETAEPAETGE